MAAIHKVPSLSNMISATILIRRPSLLSLNSCLHLPRLVSNRQIPFCVATIRLFP
ncbi:hypothetical protein EVA_04617 [gut metagenome]|uniref:Uncharacterized protein n=1 Tax=gut metagenome TaxID=749906 RepID=J9GJ67_9ZZZZ